MKKLCFVIALLAVVGTAQAQEEKINQTDEAGRRIGKWVQYYDDGRKIQSIEYYTVPIRQLIPDYKDNFLLSKEDIEKVMGIRAKEGRIQEEIIKEVQDFLNDKEIAYKADTTSITQKFVLAMDRVSKYQAGMKTGEWLQYYPNGTIRARTYYRDNEIDSILTFNESGLFVEKKTNTSYEKIRKTEPHLLGEIPAAFPKDGKPCYFSRQFDYKTKEVSFFFGRDKLIETKSFFHEIKLSQRQATKIKITLISHANQDLVLNVEALLGIKPIALPNPTVILPAKKQIDYEVEIPILDNLAHVQLYFTANSDLVVLQNIFFNVNSISMEDFYDWESISTDEQPVIIKQKISYERTEGEALLKVYAYRKNLKIKNIRKSKTTDLLTMPISKNQNELDFKGWKSGIYLLRVIDFNTNQEKYKLVKVEN